MPNKSAVLFDAYGTLFRLHTDINRLNQLCGNQGTILLDLWRQKQLSYTWLFNSMNQYENFDLISRRALNHALNVLSIEDEKIIELLMPIYKSPVAYDDVPGLLSELNNMGMRIYILSNGTTEMLSHGVRKSGIESLLDGIISVDSIQRFKPAPEVYEYALHSIGKSVEEALFISSNQWDVAGASIYGLPSLWLNRDRDPFEDMNHELRAEIFSITEIIPYLVDRT